MTTRLAVPRLRADCAGANRIRRQIKKQMRHAWINIA